MVSPEDGTRSPLEMDEKGEGGVALAVQDPKIPLPDQQAVLHMLIEQALKGTMPITRALKSNEVRCFSPLHINMVFDHVQGPMTNSEIIEKYNVSPFMATTILNHPFAEVLKAALLGQIADRLTDPLERMRATVHEMIDIKLQIVRDPNTPKRERNKIANDFLDRAGYGPRQDKNPDQENNKVPQLPEPLVTRFTAALESSARVARLPYDGFTQRGGAQETASGEQLAPTAEKAAEPSEPRTVQGLPSDSSLSDLPSEKKEKVA